MRRSAIAVGVLALLASTVIDVFGTAPSAGAAAFARSFEVNSNLFGNGTATNRPASVNSASDKDLTDGKCANAAGYCTLRAALEQANYYVDGKATLITVAPTVYLASSDGTTQTTTTQAVTPANPVTIKANSTAANYMTTSRNGYWSYGSYYVVTAPNISLDLKSSVYLSSPDISYSTLYVNGANSQIAGIKHWYSGYTIIQVGKGGVGSSFTNLHLGDDENYYAQNGIVLNNGANDITIQNSYFGGLYTGANDRNAWVTTDYNDYGYAGAYWVSVKALTVQNNTFQNTSTGSCGSTSGVGCQAKGVSIEYGTTIDGMKIANNRFAGAWAAGNQTPIRMFDSGLGANVSNLDIVGNTFSSQATGQAEGYSTITLPTDRNLTGSNYIRNNVFSVNVASTNRTGMAVFWNSSRIDQSDSGLTVSGNSFNGYGNANGGWSSMRFYEAGNVTVERNTFGPAARANNQTAAAGSDDATDGVLYNNYNWTTNAKMATWYPTAATVYNTTGQVVNDGIASGLPNPGKECSVDVAVSYPSSSGYQKPNRGARVDVYYSASASGSTMQGAEVLLGSATFGAGVVTNQLVNFPFASGKGGVIRVQTQAVNVASGSQAQSSQYSRYVTVGKNLCGPRMRVFQAAGQSDPTYARALHWTVTSTEPLAGSGPGALSISDFSIATSDCRATSVAVAGLTQISDTQWDVVVRANDSCTITLALPDGATTDTDTPPNASVTKTTDVNGAALDATITYRSPLSRTPDAATVYQGISPGKDITVVTATSTSTSTVNILDENGNVTGTVSTTVTTQQVPAAATIRVALALDNAWGVVAGAITIPTTAFSGSRELTSAADLRNAVRTSSLSYTVTSDDPNYDGLRLPATDVTEKPVAILDPVQGPTSGGTVVALDLQWTGGGDLVSVTFGTVPGIALSGSGTSYSVKTPPSRFHAITPVNVVLTFADGTTVTLPTAFTYLPRAGVSIAKQAYSDPAHTTQIATGATVLSGATVYWTYTLTNTGEISLDTISVLDNRLAANAVSCPATTLAPAASITCTASGKVGS